MGRVRGDASRTDREIAGRAGLLRFVRTALQVLIPAARMTQDWSIDATSLVWPRIKGDAMVFSLLGGEIRFEWSSWLRPLSVRL